MANARYEIRQRVSTIYRSWMELVWDTPVERVALAEFDRIKKENPDHYFELMRVETSETCIDFSTRS